MTAQFNIGVNVSTARTEVSSLSPRRTNSSHVQRPWRASLRWSTVVTSIAPQDICPFFGSPERIGDNIRKLRITMSTANGGEHCIETRQEGAATQAGSSGQAPGRGVRSEPLRTGASGRRGTHSTLPAHRVVVRKRPRDPGPGARAHAPLRCTDHVLDRYVLPRP